MQTVELNHEKLENYFYEELTDYVNVMINKDPENFIKIIKDSVYPFTVDELKCYLRLVQDSPETILYGYYKYNGINEKELFDILEDNDDLSIDKVILLILKKDLNKSGITNLNNILKAGGFTDKNIAGFLKGNYTLGNLTIDEVNQFRKEAFAKNPDIDVSLMEAKPKLLVKQFLILNKAFNHYVQRNRETLGNKKYANQLELDLRLNKCHVELLENWNIPQEMIEKNQKRNYFRIMKTYLNSIKNENKSIIRIEIDKLVNMKEFYKIIKENNYGNIKDKIFIFLLNSVHFINVAVNEIRVNHIFKVVIGIVKRLFCAGQILQDQIFFIFAHSHILHIRYRLSVGAG